MRASTVTSVRETRPLGATLACAAAFTASWDIYGVEVVGRTIKPVLALALLAVAAWAARPVRVPNLNRRAQLVALTVAALAGWLTLRTAFLPLSVALPALVSMLLILVATLAVVLHRPWAGQIARAFVWGMALTSAVAIYEWAAQRVGLPRLTHYRSGLQRAAGFSYEPAYFGSSAFAAATLCYLTWRPGQRRTAVLCVLAAGLVTANARVVVVQAVVTGVAYWLLARRDRTARKMQRRLVRSTVVAVILLAVTMLVQPSIASDLSQRAASFTDRNEAQSNAIRIRLYGNVVTVIKDDLWMGPGPGMLGVKFEERAYTPDILLQGDNGQIVANNLLLQAIGDGGLLAAGLELCLIVAVARCSRRRAELGAAWVGLVVGAGLTVSNFWDAEPWLLLGLILATSSRGGRPGLGPQAVDHASVRGADHSDEG